MQNDPLRVVVGVVVVVVRRCPLGAVLSPVLLLHVEEGEGDSNLPGRLLHLLTPPPQQQHSGL